MKAPGGYRSAALRWGARCFPAALLLLVGLFFAGRLGWWSDDYWHCQRDAVTGQVRAWTMDRGFFLRPLFYRVVPAVTTAFWNHDWIAHAIQIAAHALVTVMLWRLIVMLGVGREGGSAAGAAALLFMVYPAQFEALYWVAALPTVLSAGVMLGVMMMAVLFARGRTGWWALALMAGMTFGAACLNEQPVSVVVALPLLAWVARERRWVRLLAPGGVCGVAALVYVALLRFTPRPPGVRGSAETLVTAGQLWERSVYFCDVLWRRVVMKNFAWGALREGTERVYGSWVGVAAVLAGTLLGVAWATIGRTRNVADVENRAPSGRGGTAATSPDGGGWGVAALGVAVFVVGWLPILVMAVYEPDSRCRYWPDVGLAMVVGAAIDAAVRRWGDVPPLRGSATPDMGARGFPPGLLAVAAARLRATGIAARGVGVAVLLVWSVMLVGVQAGFASRWRWDREGGEELKRQAPDPAPYTMFVPLRVDQKALATGSPVLDSHFRSVWEFPWSSVPFTQRLYRREDVRCGYWRHWTPRVPVRGGDERGLHYDDANMVAPRFPRMEDGTNLIPWERCVPFIIEQDGTLRVVTRVVLERAGDADLVIEMPQAKGLPAFEARLKRL